MLENTDKKNSEYGHHLSSGQYVHFGDFPDLFFDKRSIIQVFVLFLSLLSFITQWKDVTLMKRLAVNNLD